MHTITQAHALPKIAVEFHSNNSWAANRYLETGEPAIPYPAYKQQQHRHTHSPKLQSNAMAATHGLRIATWRQLNPLSPTPHTQNNTNITTHKTYCPFRDGSSWDANSYQETGEPAIPYPAYTTTQALDRN